MTKHEAVELIKRYLDILYDNEVYPAKIRLIQVLTLSAKALERWIAEEEEIKRQTKNQRRRRKKAA